MKKNTSFNMLNNLCKLFNINNNDINNINDDILNIDNNKKLINKNLENKMYDNNLYIRYTNSFDKLNELEKIENEYSINHK